MVSKSKITIPILIIFTLSLFFSVIHSQNIVGEWENYTSTLEMQDIVYRDGRFFIATSGGLLLFAEQGKTFQEFNKKAGLSSLNVKTLKLDDHQVLWMGMAEGELNFFDLEQMRADDNYIENYNISSFQENLDNVSAIAGRDRNIFVSCQKQLQWGIIHFIKKNDSYLYKDYYFRFPDILEPITDLLVHRDSLYLATENGIYASDFVNSNLKSPENWIRVDSPEEFNVQSLVRAGGDNYLVANSSLYKMVNQSIVKINNELNGKINKIFLNNPDKLWIITNRAVYSFNPDNKQSQLLNNENTIKVVRGNTSELYGITREKGIWVWNNQQNEYYLPNTLVSNKYTSIFVGQEDRIAAASSKGISFSTELGWYNIVKTDDYEQTFKGNSINEVSPDYFTAGSLAYDITSNGKIWSLIQKGEDYYATLHRSSIKGDRKGGLLKVNPAMPQNYEVYDTTNSILTASEGVGAGSAHYLVPAAMKLDQEGNLWVLNQYAQNGNVVAVQTVDGEWYHYSINESGNRLTHFLNDITFANNKEVWFASAAWSGEPFSHGGIIMLDHNGTIGNKDDDSWKRFDKSDGLEDNDVFSLDFDETGTLWTMTIAGIQKAEVSNQELNFIMFNNGKYNLFSNLSFANFCRLKVDRDNNIWFSTESEGMKVFSKTGEWWPLGDIGDSLDYSEGFTEDNSDLLSNTILDFDFNEEQGKVYFATDRGISVLKYRYPVMQKKYKKLTAFPSPFIIPRHNKLVIDGLLENSSIKIMTLTGELVVKINHNNDMVKGRQLHWDGRNKDGNYISSGVYIVMAYNDEGKSKAGKIAVVRE